MNPNKGILLKPPPDGVPRKRRNHLLLIGIDDYKHWTKLHYPTKDCDQLFQVLKEHYGFQEQDLIQSLYNEQATADIIFDELYRLQEQDEEGNPRLGPDDNLILYFSGHGHLDKSLDEGYWAPEDAPVPVKNRPSDLRKLVSVSEVVKILSQVKAHHIVLIVDACFSGAFTRMAVEVMPGGDPNNPEEKPSRWVLTAGRLEPVPDKSEFAEALRQVLGENDRSRLSVQTLGTAVKDRVAESGRHTPACISLVEQKYEGGEFFFYRRTAVQLADQAPRPSAAIAKLPERLRQGSAAHLERLKKGRFKHLNIIQLLLTGNNLPDLIDTQVKSGDTETPLQQAVQSLWGREKPHAVVLGDGGMGKTVSLVRLWEDMLRQSAVGSWQSAVPVFVALNEYNAIPESEKHDFVLRSIARNCGLAEALTDDWKNALWEFLKTPLSDGSPSVLLLLDGFNEVTVKKDQLLIDLNRLSEQAKGMQMVITSRYVEIQNFTWAQNSEVIELLPLPPDKIGEYLQQVNLPLPEDEALQKLFGNPMMLTLYAGASSIAKKYEHDKRFRFLPTGSYGELLWNFNEAQLARHLEDLEHDPDEQAWHCFLLRCLVPRLAYKMELEGQFFVPTRKALNPTFNFKTLLDEAFTDLNREELTEVFPELMGRRSLLGLGELTDLDARERRSQKVLKYLVDKLHLLVAEDEALRFVHQNFRDFFAAVHLLNEIDLSQVTPNLIPQSWKERTFPVYLRRMLGNIEGEHHYDPKKFANGDAMPGFQPQSRLTCLLDTCRGIFNVESVRYTVWNAVQCIADASQTLAGRNLEQLDLSMLYLNNIPLSNHLNHYKYLSANLRGSLLSGNILLFKGHTHVIWSVCYSPDGKKVLTGSNDNSVKEWSVENGECLHTYYGKENYIDKACYSPDGKKILTGGGHVLIEWLVETRECLRPYKGHSSSVTQFCYSPDGKKILSCSYDETIKEWSVESGECIQTYKGHSSIVNNVCYSPDGEKILSCSYETIKEWSVKSRKCIQTIETHTHSVNSICYSPCGKKILSGGGDNLVKEWAVKTGEIFQTFVGHTNTVKSASYSPDGKKILSASFDKMAKEWSVENGECLHTFLGHSGWITSACYSPDGSKLVSGAWDLSVKEWSVRNGECLRTFAGYSNWVMSSCFSPNNKKILVQSLDNSLREWSWNKNMCLRTFTKCKSGVYSHDGNSILLAINDNEIKEWSLLYEWGKLVLSGHDEHLNNLCYSPDRKKALTTSSNEIREWSLSENKLIRTYIGHDSNVDCVAYSPDGSKVLSGSYDKTAKIWSAESGECLRTFKGHTDKVNHVCYSIDGEKILTAFSNVIWEWSLVENKFIRAYIGHGASVRCVIYSPDGSKVLSGSHDKTAKEWSAESGECLRTFEGHLDAVNHVSYSKDAKSILSCSNDGTIKEWSAESGRCQNTMTIEPGISVCGCDFRHLHPSSHFTEEEKERLRRYGAIFTDEDERRWKEAVADACGDLENEDEPKDLEFINKKENNHY